MELEGGEAYKLLLPFTPWQLLPLCIFAVACIASVSIGFSAYRMMSFLILSVLRLWLAKKSRGGVGREDGDPCKQIPQF